MKEKAGEILRKDHERKRSTSPEVKPENKPGKPSK